MSTLLSLLPLARQKTALEWAGPCPACGEGDDRFIVWPDRPRGGAYLCRICGAAGDGIDFLRRFQGMSYPEACKAVGVTPDSTRTISTRKKPEPEQPKLPGKEWMQAAARFLASCQGHLTDPDAVAMLAARGLTPDTARRCGLGWNPTDRYEARAAWGLPSLQGKDKLLLPRGLVIATRRRSGVLALTIRTADPDRPKYWQVAGAGNVPFVAGRAGLPVVLLESALDACLLNQEAGELVAAVALMGNMKGMDSGTDAFIKAAPAVIAAPDNDEGGRAAWLRWKATYPVAVLCPAVGGKDLTDAHRAALKSGQGVTVREWLLAALSLALPHTPEAPAAVPFYRTCPDYWQNCHACPDFHVNKISFCGKSAA